MAIVNNLTVSIKKHKLLDNVSCSLMQGRITSFIGKSGAGKTTLLKSLTGLIPIESGDIIINNKKLTQLTATQRSEEIGYVFQNFNLFPQLTVLENCMHPLRVHGKSYEQALQIALHCLQALEMNDYIQRYPFQLSGGQQQRVAIARALCLKPHVILLDEPTASLDPINTDILVFLLKKLAHIGLTVAFSSQDMNFVRKIFDRIYYVESGKIIEFCESPEQIDKCPNIKKWIS